MAFPEQKVAGISPCVSTVLSALGGEKFLSLLPTPVSIALNFIVRRIKTRIRNYSSIIYL